MDPAADLIRRSLPLTMPAPNWDAWSSRPLRLEVETPRAWASLPMAMEMRDASFPPIPHGCFSGCELSRGLYWLAAPDPAHGTVLVPRGHFWVRDGKGGRSEDRALPDLRLRVADEDGLCRLGSCPPEVARVARRLHREPVPARWLDETEDVPEKDVNTLLGALVGARLAVGAGLGPVFPDAVGQYDVASRPFRVGEAGCEDGRIHIEGPLGIRCLAEFDRLCGVRVSESVLGGEILLDLWRDGEGFSATWRLHFSHTSGEKAMCDEPVPPRSGRVAHERKKQG